MFIGNILSSLSRAFLLALATVSVSAAAKFDLERVKPVPAGEPIPTMDFFRPSLLSQPVLNPSGTRVAAVVTAAEDKHILLVYDLKTPEKVEMVGGSGDKDIYRVDWLSDSRVMFGLSSKKLYGIGLMAADVGSLQSGYAIQQYNNSQVISVPLKNRLRPLIWNRFEMETGNDAGVAAVNTDIQTGALVDLDAAMNSFNRRDLVVKTRDNNDRHIAGSFAVPPTGINYRYSTDKAGELAYSYTAQQDGNLTMYRLADQQWIKCPVDLEHVHVEGAGNEPGQLIAIGPRQEGKPRALQLLDPATGKLGDVILQDKAYDFDGYLYRNPATGDVLGAVYQRNGPQVYWFNEEYRNLQKLLDGFFPGVVVRILGSDLTHKIFLVATSSDKQPEIYSWVNLETRATGIVKNSAPWIDPQRMQPMKIVKFKTRDDRQLDAYLTLPAGASKVNPPPLVVLCHGGPWVRDTWGFDREVQFLASHGYAVMQPNYRGSTGYDWMFPEEDQYDFVKMHNDVTDATKMLAGSGLIDRTRVAIMGASFGGYLAIAGVAHEPDLYRCAVTNAGVFDWALQVQVEKFDRYDLPYYGRRIKKLGDPKKEPEKFAAMSPINFVDKIRVPVFVAGGKDDQTVEIRQSKRLISALDKYKVPYEKLFAGEEGHGMRHLKNEVELYDRIVVFLDKHLKSAQPVAAAAIERVRP
jgi:dipeptidyl aminopeptidase/acylaminoacyl peptidase